MKKLAIYLTLIALIVTIGCNPGLPGGGGGGTVDTGYPSDFPQLIDQGGPGAGSALSGFGGDTSTDQAGNRAAVQRVPVILIHGNGANATSTQWGWATMKGFLKAAGYNDSEIWAVSYLGANNSSADMNDPHKNNIEDVRIFVDAVLAYLNVPKVVLIGHSLGAGMIRCYLNGLKQGTHTYDSNLSRFNKVAALITLAGGNYGLGINSTGEFKSNSTFEKDTHRVAGSSTYDDTPYGANSASKMSGGAVNSTLPLSRNYNGSNRFSGVSSIDVEDTSPQRIYYAGLTATGDFVDAQLANTGYLQGADINKGWSLGASLTGHEKIIKDQTVFNEGILPILQKANAAMAPQTPVVTINPNGGSFTNGETVNISLTATNNPTQFEYKIGDGAWTSGSSFTVNGNSETVTVQAKAANSEGWGEIKSAQFTFTSGPVPVVSISPASTSFTDSIQVSISATENPTLIQYSTDGGASWNTYSGSITITDTATVKAKAQNANGWSTVAEATYTKQAGYQEVTATVNTHQSEGRFYDDNGVWLNDLYMAACSAVNYNTYSTPLTMYKPNGAIKWQLEKP